MDDWTKTYYGLRFRIDFLERKGASFQDLFVSVMSKAHPKDFMPCRPWGRSGDRKNDGYLPTEQLLCQVYAPNELTSAKTIKKIEADFKGAMLHWKKYFHTWAFVHNTDGLPPEVIEKIEQLRSCYPSIEIQTWGFDALLHRFHSLSEEAMAPLYGPLPPITNSALIVSSNTQPETRSHFIDVLYILRAVHPTDVRTIVLGMCDKCMDYYRTLFRPVYEDTIRLLGAAPREPASEIFNAFDHFARATEAVSKISAHDASQETDFSDELSGAFLEVERARMHIAMGVFYCYEHHLVHLLDALGTNGAELREVQHAAGELDDDFLSAMEAECIELSQRSSDLKLVSPINSISEAMSEIAKIEKASEELCQILNKYLKISLQLADRLDSCRSKIGSAPR
jgi:hypothetical protein